MKYYISYCYSGMFFVSLFCNKDWDMEMNSFFLYGV